MIPTGMFYSRHDAEEAVKLLHALGYRDDEISVIARSSGSGVTEGVVVIGVTPHERDRGRRDQVVAPSETGRVHTETGEVEPTEFTPDEDPIPPRRVVS